MVPTRTVLSGNRPRLPAYLSRCGRYIATVDPSLGTLKVCDVGTEKIRNAYDLNRIICAHLGLETLPYKIDVQSVQWELLAKEVGSSKLAVLVGNFFLVLVLDLRDANGDAIIIQQGSHEGVEGIAWISPIEEDGDGAYVNCKQLLVYTKNWLVVKLYSLDCTHVLWKLARPLSRAPIIRDESTWTLLFESREPEVEEQRPVVYHFHNSGSKSELLYRFRLPIGLLSEGFEMFWTVSGKWLVYFNAVDPLFGFKLKVFNALGVNQNEFNDTKRIPVGDPIISVDWLTDGIRGESPLDIGADAYSATSMQFDEITEYIIVCSVAQLNQIEFITVSIKDFRTINRQTTQGYVTATTWNLYDDGDLRYVDSVEEFVTADLKLNQIISVSDEKHYLVLCFDRLVMVVQVLLDGVSISVVYEPVSVINTGSNIVSVKREGHQIVIVCKSHVAMYDLQRNRVAVAHHERSKGSLLAAEKFGETLVMLHENSGERLAEVMQLEEVHQSSPEKAVESPGGHLGARIRRNRFTDRVGLHNLSMEDNTDTFQHKRTRREGA